MTAAAIETSGLTRLHAPDAGVRELDLQVPQGAIYAFLGPNGAGKTTTIRLLLGLLQPDAGRIVIEGRVLDARSRQRPWIGSMVEGPSLYPHLSGRENLGIAARLLGVGKEDREAALRTVGLEGQGDRLARDYSLGMRQRLGIAMALLGRPRLLVLDEPGNGLDPAGMADMRTLMRDLVREHGMTIFLSSHLLDDVEKVATHVGLLHRGRLLAQGPIASLRRQQVRIACDAPGQARALLDAAGYQVAGEVGGVLRVEAAEVDAPAINRQLVLAGIGVMQLQAGQGRLEDFFSRMTGAEAVA